MISRTTLRFLFLVLYSSQSLSSNVSCRHLDVVVIGGTGDLAKRYLWNGFFRLFQRERNVTNITFYGAGKSEMSHEIFKQIVLASIFCDETDINCNQDRQTFLTLCQYRTVKKEMDYRKLCSAINASNIIFYLSVPPVAYQKILVSIAQHCNISDVSKDFKFVFEKPFGTDLQSALSLSNILMKYLNEDQIYRVDHYLSDDTIRNILDFRSRNHPIERMMNHHYLMRIEVVASEKVGCEGRTSYYDASGVLRDMLQNHLTEILCLITKNVGESESRLQLLKSISSVSMKDVYLGQYSGYSREVMNETKIKDSNTATFARVRLHIEDPRWRKVPIWLTSGKQVKGKNVYARLIFKKKAAARLHSKDCSSTPQVIFVRNHRRLSSSAILISHTLPISKQYMPSGWTTTVQFNNISIFGEKGKCFVVFVPNMTVEHAYTKVIESLYKGDRDNFVPTETLLESWRVWSAAIDLSDRAQYVVSYPKGYTLRNVVALRFKPVAQRCVLSNIFLKKCDLR